MNTTQTYAEVAFWRKTSNGIQELARLWMPLAALPSKGQWVKVPIDGSGDSIFFSQVSNVTLIYAMKEGVDNGTLLVVDLKKVEVEVL